jgi:hypothetical protein
MQTLTDSQLKELARKRVEFRTHLVVYLIINSALWLTWYLTGRGYIWPVWPLVGWGVGLLFHYLFEYRTSRLFSEQDEFDHLKKRFEKPEQH